MGIAGDAISTLVSLLFLLPIFTGCTLVVLKWTISGDIDALAGIFAMLVLVGTMFVSLATKNQVMQGVAVVGAISLIAMFPFAANYLDRHDLREINAEHIDKTILELSIRPDNFPAWFKLAESLFTAGYHGHAIALAEQTLARIPNNMDPFHNRSMRDLYRSEEIMVKKWRRDATNPKRHRPIACPKCGQQNQPGTINCIKCETPYLLLLSRNVGTRTGAFAKLVIGWALIAGLLPFGAYMGTMDGGGLLAIGGTLAAVVGVGVVLRWVFRDPSGQPEKFQSFS